jgi:hypothetical protein
MSNAVLKLVHLAQESGLSSRDGEWSEAFVYWFDALMPEGVRSAGSAEPSLDYFDSEGTPHTPAGEGFIDRGATTAISFLLEVKERC